jgi:tetratricopeptide (TPR) repeat protein
MTAPQAYREGIDLYGRGDYEDAIRSFRTALEQDPKLYRAYAFLGLCYGAQEKYEEAQAAYEACLSLEPAYHKATNNLGEIYRRTGHPNKARSCFERACQLAPDEARYWYNLGLTWVDGGKPKEGLQAYRRAHDLAPSDFQILTDLVALYMHVGDRDSAIRIVEGFQRRYPDHPRMAELRARETALRRIQQPAHPA